MAATTQELIKKGFQIHSKTTSRGLKEKIEMIASHYGNISSFLKASRQDLNVLVFKIGDLRFSLTDADFAKLQAFQQSGLLDAKLSIQQNFIVVLTTQFINRQLEMIDSMRLETLNVNPILAGALNLNNASDLIRYYTYQAISRSMVTSVGFLVQDLLLYSSDFVLEGKYDELGEVTKWDIVVEKLDEVKAYLEVKSGTNDLRIVNSEFVIECLENNVRLAESSLLNIMVLNKVILDGFTAFVNHILVFFADNIQHHLSKQSSETLYLSNQIASQ